MSGKESNPLGFFSSSTIRAKLDTLISQGHAQIDVSLLQQAHSARMAADWSSAYGLYEKAAQSDSSGEAEAWLSICYMMGLGCKKDEPLAYRHAFISAERGCAFGVNNLGHCLENGIGCKRDIEQAVRMYEQAVSYGEQLAMNNLGLCLQIGNGVVKDERRAVQLFQKSASMGNSYALNSLGNCYFQGVGLQQNYEQAFALYEQAAQNRTMNKSALYNLGVCLYSGKGTARDLNEAFVQFQKAADLGLDIAQYRVGVCLRDAIGCERDSDLALENFQAAAAQGMTKANVALLDLMMDNTDDSYEAASSKMQQKQSPAVNRTSFQGKVISPMLKVISPMKPSLHMQDDQEPPVEQSRPSTPDPSISQMHLFQLQQEFAEHLKKLRVRHEQEIISIRQHFEPLIATASSLVNRVHSSTSGIPSASYLYCILSPGMQQHDVAVESQAQQSRNVDPSPPDLPLSTISISPISKNDPILILDPSATSSPASSNDAVKRISPTSFACSPSASPAGESPATLSNPSADTNLVSPGDAVSGGGDSNPECADSLLQLSSSSSNGIANSYKRVIVIRHTQNKLL
jgi:TPR repeat protein